MSVFLGLGDGTLTAPKEFYVKAMPVAIVTPDLNNDGSPDLVVANSLGIVYARSADEYRRHLPAYQELS